MDLDKILNQLCEKNKFVNMKEVESIFVNYNLSQDEQIKVLKKIYDHNCQLNKKLKSENTHLKAVIENKMQPDLSLIKNKVCKIKDQVRESEEVNEDLSLKIDISFYMESLNKINDVSEMKNFLPSQNNQTTVDIINTILFNLLEDMMIIKRLLNNSDCESDDISYYQIEYDQLKEKVDNLKKYLKDLQMNKQVKSKKENKIIFLKTDTGNNCFMNDLLKNVDPHYYRSMKELLESIKNGEFKNVKSFIGNRFLVGLSEVKGYQTRIIFKRLKSDLYIVMQAIVKKMDNSQHYRSTIVARYDMYKKQEEKINKMIQIPEFLDENNLEYKNIINVLDTEQKGDSNDRTYQKNK